MQPSHIFLTALPYLDRNPGRIGLRINASLDKVPMTDQTPILGILKQFDAAYAKVTSDQRDIYGDPRETYRRVAALRTIVDECAGPQIREIIEMVATKLARLVQTPDRVDSWIDVAGYARTAAMVWKSRQLACSEPSPGNYE